MASDIVPTDSWARARQRFLEELDESEKASFQSATFENIFYSASAAQKAHQADSVSRAVAARMNALLTGINEWGQALDVYANASTMILSPLWGSIRVLIHLSSEFEKYFDCLVDMLAQIGDVVPRFKIYERLYPSHARLTQALSAAYFDVLEFCTAVKRVFKRAKRNVVVNIRILLKVAWKSVDKQFGILMTRFRRHRKEVEKEAGLSNLLEEGSARDIESRVLLKLEQQANEKERIRVLSMLSSIYWEKQHWKALNSRHKDTGTWIFDIDEFRDWKEMHFSGCLRCHGIPGCGKTVLSAGVAETLSREVNHDRSIIAYFYCDYGNNATLDLGALVGTIIQQLLIVKKTIPDPIAVTIREIYDDGLRQPQLHKLTELLFSIMREYELVYIVLDGIDEASEDTQKGILDLINQLITTASITVKVFLSSRENPQISKSLGYSPVLHISEKYTAQDIGAYIRNSVTDKLANHSVIRDNPGLQAELEHELLKKAQGMFLWVFFQVEELSDPSHSKHSFQRTIRNLPRGLTETYQRISQKIAKKSERQIIIADRIFMWTLNARRHLTLSELREAIAIEPGDEHWERTKISTEADGKRFLQNCGSLVLFDEMDNTVRLAHHTVSQYLRQHTVCGEKGDDLLADVCLTYLNFADFAMQLTPATEKFPIIKLDHSAQSSFSRIMQLLGINSGIYDFLISLYNPGARKLSPDVDYVELLSQLQMQSRSVPFEKKYQLLNYVRSEWIWHTSHLEKSESLRWQCLRNMVFLKVLPFEFRPWGISHGPQGLPHLTMFLWALGRAHRPLLLLLQDSAPLTRYLEFDTAAQLKRVIIDGRLDILDLFLCEDHRVASNQMLIRQAFLSRQIDILTKLLQCADPATVLTFLSDTDECLSESLNSIKDVSQGSSIQVLHIAAYEGNIQLSRLLLEHGAKLDLPFSSTKTPLFYACCSPDTVSRVDRSDTIQLLLHNVKKPELFVNLTDSNGDTALQCMIRQGLGREDILQILIEKHADLHHMNRDNESIFETVVVHAPANILRFFCQHGFSLETEVREMRTPLLHTLASGKPKWERENRALLLVASGADVNKHDEKGMTALHHALSRKFSIALVKCFLDAGADVNARDLKGRIPLYLAVTSGSTEMIAILIQYGVDPNLFDSRWEPVLIFPIRHGDDNVVETLLKGGADPNSMSHGDPPRSALICAAIFGQSRIADLLIRSGAEVKPSPSNLRCDPFYWAVREGSAPVLRVLLKQLKRNEKDYMEYLWDHAEIHPSRELWNSPNYEKVEMVKSELRRFGIPEKPVVESTG